MRCTHQKLRAYCVIRGRAFRLRAVARRASGSLRQRKGLFRPAGHRATARRPAARGTPGYPPCESVVSRTCVIWFVPVSAGAPAGHVLGILCGSFAREAKREAVIIVLEK